MSNQGLFKCIQTPGKSTGYVGDNVHLAAYITAGARSMLCRAIVIAGPENVYYCDTDSLFVNAEGFRRLQAAGLLHEDMLGLFKL